MEPSLVVDDLRGPLDELLLELLEPLGRLGQVEAAKLGNCETSTSFFCSFSMTSRAILDGLCGAAGVHWACARFQYCCSAERTWAITSDLNRQMLTSDFIGVITIDEFSGLKPVARSTAAVVGDLDFSPELSHPTGMPAGPKLRTRTISLLSREIRIASSSFSDQTSFALPTAGGEQGCGVWVGVGSSVPVRTSAIMHHTRLMATLLHAVETLSVRVVVCYEWDAKPAKLPGDLDKRRNRGSRAACDGVGMVAVTVRIQRSSSCRNRASARTRSIRHWPRTPAHAAGGFFVGPAPRRCAAEMISA